jgi:hypothetical protein
MPDGVDASQAPSLTLSPLEVAFLAARLRRLFAHFGTTLPKFAENDARLIGIAGSAIGMLLTGRTAGVEGKSHG